MGRELRAVVKWQDKSRDTSYEITEKTPGHEWANYNAERYQEVVSKSYWDWVEKSSEYRSGQAGTTGPSEPLEANPDFLSEEAERPFGHFGGAAQPSGPRVLLDEALKTLTDKQRQIWEMLMVDGAGQEEVAEALGISQPVVCKTLLAARKKVLAYLEANKSRIGEADE